MENELLTIFDQQQNRIGVATRKDVHKFGYWHESFHCWFINVEQSEPYIYLQLRSPLKKDYPNLLDITAAGHLLASETIRDGVREIQEELGLEVPFEDLISLGTVKYSATQKDFIDKELANLFLYKSAQRFEEFTLQHDEVSAIFKTKFSDFKKLWNNERNEIEIIGFNQNFKKEKQILSQFVSRNDFVPHNISFYELIISKIEAALKQ